MKKSVILAILAVYILSIVVVGLLGMKIAVYDEIKYVETINLIDSPDGDYKVVNRTVTEQGVQKEVDYIILSYKPDLRFKLYYEVLPLDATNKAVAFYFDTDDYSDAIEVSKDGVVSVMQNTTIVLRGYIEATDGNKTRSREICIYIKENFDL